MVNGQVIKDFFQTIGNICQVSCRHLGHSLGTVSIMVGVMTFNRIVLNPCTVSAFSEAAAWPCHSHEYGCVLIGEIW
jgi:hypothetical protein